MSASTCSYCHLNPGTNENGLWKGFKDADTGALVCWGCQSTHYKTKHTQPGMAGLYSEMPVMIHNPQLTLQL